MGNEKKHYFVKLIPPRSTFNADMTAEERAIMQKHVDYWSTYVDDGAVTLLVLGPVKDPKGSYNIAVMGVDSKEQLDELIAKDPVNRLSSYEIYPMKVLTELKLK